MILSKSFERSRDAWFFEYPSTTKLNCRNELNICVVYAVWGNKYYAQCLYWSLLSQQKFTDIQLADVKIFVSPLLHTYLDHLIAPFGVDIIEEDKLLSKLGTIVHPSLSDYKYLVLLDADSFFCGKKGNVYQSVVDLEIKTVGMLPDIGRAPTKGMVKIHQKISFQKNPIKYLRGLAEAIGISDQELAKRIDNTAWHFAWFCVCNLNFFRNVSWRRLSQYANDIQAGEEVVMVAYAHEHIEDVDSLFWGKDIKLSVGTHSIELFREECDFVKLIHPARVGRADHRILDSIIEDVLKEPHAISTDHAQYRCPIHIGRRFGYRTSRFSKLKPTKLKRILCLGCSFTNLRFGWPYFLARILPSDYEVVNLGWRGAGTDLFIQISKLLTSYEPSQVICQSMSPSRKVDEQKNKEFTDMWLKTNMSLEEESGIRLLSWILSRNDDFSQAAADAEFTQMKYLRTVFDCPLFFMTNKYGYPYEEFACKCGDVLDKLWNYTEIVTDFLGIEYETCVSQKGEKRHPSIKRSKEEAECIFRSLRL